MATLVQMLMYGKEARNQKQEIDRQHYTIPNQRLKATMPTTAESHTFITYTLLREL